MTALNNTIRDKIIDSVISRGTTIPARKESLIKRTETRVRELCVARVPAEFYAAVNTLPAEWFPHTVSESMDPKVNPISIVKLDEDELRKAWRSDVSFEAIKHPYDTRFSRNPYKHRGPNKPEDMASWEANLDDLIGEAKRIVADEKQARTELRQFLHSVKTYKQVLEKMPEIEAYLPEYSKPMPLTVSVAPLLSTLGKLGFDAAKGA